LTPLRVLKNKNSINIFYNNLIIFQIYILSIMKIMLKKFMVKIRNKLLIWLEKEIKKAFDWIEKKIEELDLIDLD